MSTKRSIQEALVLVNGILAVLSERQKTRTRSEKEDISRARIRIRHEAAALKRMQRGACRHSVASITRVMANVLDIVVALLEKYPPIAYHGTKERAKMDIGALLRVLRRAKKMNQGQLAARVGISQNYLSMIENGQRQPSTKILEQISISLNVPLAFLVMYRSGVPEGLGNKERELVGKLKELCVDFLKLKLGLETSKDAQSECAETREG
jgi:transcriptional regulator with XRE-family HTH domain